MTLQNATNRVSDFSQVQGFEFSVDAGNTQYIDIAAGKGTVLNNATNIRYVVSGSSTIVKQLNAAWAIGTNAGGLLTGSSFPASTTLHAYLMRRRSDGAVDHGFHTSATQTTFTDGSSNVWDLQLHMSITTLASSIRGIKHVGNLVTYIDPVQSDIAAAIGTTAALYTLSIPTGIKLYPVFRAHLGTPTTSPTYCFYYFSDPDTTDSTPANSLAVGSAGLNNTSPTALYTSTPLIDNIQCDTSARIRGRSSVAAASLNNTIITTYGYYHPRGGNPTASQTIVLNNGFTYVGYFAGGTPPATPITGDTWRETSSSNVPVMDWYWDGSTWKSIALFSALLPPTGATVTISANTTRDFVSIVKNSWNVYIDSLYAIFFVATTNSGSAYWTVSINYATAGSGTTTAISGATLNSSTFSAGIYNASSVTALNALITAANIICLNASFTKTGSPGTLTPNARVDYRYSRP